jgi:hypothetical protein
MNLVIHRPILDTPCPFPHSVSNTHTYTLLLTHLANRQARVADAPFLREAVRQPLHISAAGNTAIYLLLVVVDQPANDVHFGLVNICRVRMAL